MDRRRNPLIYRTFNSLFYKASIVMHPDILTYGEPHDGHHQRRASPTPPESIRHSRRARLGMIPAQIIAGMHWLPTNDAVVLSAICAAIGVPIIAAAGRGPRWLAWSGAVLRELALVLGLYAVWGFAGRLAATESTGAVRRGQQVWDAERWLHLPNERTLQGWVLPHHGLVRALNMYYAFAHVPSLFFFLIWLFFRHRHRYPVWRNTLAFLTLSCLLVQFVPVAPPRLVPNLAMIDTGLKFGPTVYQPIGQGGPDQFSAMPSVHVGWAALFTLAIIIVGKSRWRWWMLLHLFMTVAGVTLTANHYFLDGIVAAGLIGTSWLLSHGLRLIYGVVRRNAHVGISSGIREPASSA